MQFLAHAFHVAREPDRGRRGAPELDGATALSSTLAVTGASTPSSTLGVTGDVNVKSGNFVVSGSDGSASMKGGLTISMDTATISHTGTSGGLAISSGQYVYVESVRITGANIGVSGDTDLIGLASGVMTVIG